MWLTSVILPYSVTIPLARDIYIYEKVIIEMCFSKHYYINITRASI